MREPAAGSRRVADRPPPVLAVSLDYWDTLYVGAHSPERKLLRRGALRRLLHALGDPIGDDELAALYHASGEEAERWWRGQRGYTARDRFDWALARRGHVRPADCAHVAAAVAVVDEALARHPAPLLSGAAALVRGLAARGVTLAITSDTGFASGAAQDALLERDGLLAHFAVRVYSCDVGHPKPHPAPFRRLVAALGVAPGAVIHVGDNEQTDVRGALEAGLRAVRLDAVRAGGASEAEHVARSLDDLRAYLLAQLGGGAGAAAPDEGGGPA